MIAWTIEAVRASRNVDRLVVSTADAEITVIAQTLGSENSFCPDGAMARAVQTIISKS